MNKKATIIKLMRILIENFKGIKSLDIDFGDVTVISGKNASGKTTISDAFSWLLFDKDSNGNSTFAIRPKDADGKDIDNIEIKVEATLDVDGETITLTKIQKQKWTKHRGSTAPTFEGNVNEFQVNGFPAKKSEYESQIHSLIDESLFKLITNPRTFAAMKWQDQRKTLMEFVSEITDEDVLNTDSEKYEPIKADVLAAGSDKSREKANVALKALKKEQLEYPVRIDEAMRNIKGDVGDDENALIEEKARIEATLQAIQNERNGLSTASDITADILNQITQKQRRIAEIERCAMLEDEKKRLKAIKDANDAEMRVHSAESGRDALANKRNFLDAAIKESTNAKTELKDQYVAFASAKFPESETICPTCGRPFDADKIEELKADFENRRQAQLEAINKKGFSLKDKIESYKTQRDQIEKQIIAYTADIEGLNAKWEEMKRIASQNVRTDVTAIPEYKNLQSEIDALNKQLASVEDTSSGLKDIEEREKFVRIKLNQIESEIAKCDASKQSEERIEELKVAQRECGQKIADCERIIYLLEEFTQLKMNTLSDRINSHFEKVRFKLFEKLINGSVKETCQMQICTNGSYVDYASANRSGQIIGGIDVIHALKELNQISAPIWIDNAECFSSDNIPTSDSQVILLTVSDDEKLVIERR